MPSIELRVRFGAGVGKGSSEESEGPVFRQSSGFEEHNGNCRVANLDSGEELNYEAGGDVVELEDIRVAVLDHDSRPRQRRELGKQIGHAAVDKAGGEVGDGLAFHCDNQLTVEFNTVVPGRKCPAFGAGLLGGETVGVVLSGVDQDDELALT